MRSKLLTATALALSLGLFAGCTSVNARIERVRHASLAEMQQKQSADNLRKIATEKVNQLVEAEVERLGLHLERQNVAAHGIDSLIAQNYINYFAAMKELKARADSDHERIGTYYGELIQLSKSFNYLNSMADEELKIAQETAKLVVEQAIATAEQTWKAYEAAHPPKLPHDEPPDYEPSPTPVPTPLPPVETEYNWNP